MLLGVPTLSLGESAFTAVPGQIQSYDYHYQTILTTPIKLHYTYLPVRPSTRLMEDKDHMYFSMYHGIQHNAIAVTQRIPVEHINI